LDEPEERRMDVPWTYSQDCIDSNLFDYEWDKELIKTLVKDIHIRL